MSYEVADVLDSAADYIERHGWTQGVLKSAAGKVCAGGAIVCLSSRDIKIAALSALASQLGDHARSPLIAVPYWNDAPDRTEQQVLDALRAAAKSQRTLADGARW